MQKHLSSALSHCQLALVIDSGHAIARFRLAQIHRAMHSYEAALRSYRTVKILLSDQQQTSNAKVAMTMLKEEIDKCEYDRSQYDAAYIRQLMQTDSTIG